MTSQKKRVITSGSFDSQVCKKTIWSPEEQRFSNRGIEERKAMRNYKVSAIGPFTKHAFYMTQDINFFPSDFILILGMVQCIGKNTGI